ncbi:MAG: glutamate racemase [Candidatus Hydrogenedens sp.]|jgi:glutamate racemase|nr:glutamate racemase [Candidatus Hydrogenedens sp.]
MTHSPVNNHDAPIGIFDSGVGGLTVCRQIARQLPREHFVYLGDTARVPYGSKSQSTILCYARACARLLLEHDIKALVIACNTATAYALEALQEELSIPVIGVVEPGALAAVKHTQRGKVGVIGTRALITSRAYEQILASLAPDLSVFTQACPLFVPFAEEGWTEGKAIHAVAHQYLEGLTKKNIDTLVLGCTHYPLLRQVIQEVMGPEVVLVDSAEETAKAVAAVLEVKQIQNSSSAEGKTLFLVTDSPETFAYTGEKFWGAALKSIQWTDICL